MSLYVCVLGGEDVVSRTEKDTVCVGVGVCGCVGKLAVVFTEQRKLEYGCVKCL